MSLHREGEVWESSEMARNKVSGGSQPGQLRDCPEALSVQSLERVHGSAEMGSLHELESTAGS